MGHKGVGRATNVPPSKVHTWKSAHWKLGSQPPEQEPVRVLLWLNEKSIHSLSCCLCASHKADHITARLVRTSGVARQSIQPVCVDHPLAKYGRLREIPPVSLPPVQPEALTHEKIMRSEAELQLGFTLLEGEKRRRR
jgi:hypothetical protein